jgi:hypothetical protein
VNPYPFGRPFVCALALVCGLATSAAAQEPSGVVPFADLFGDHKGPGQGQGSTNTLSLRGGLFSGFDDNVRAVTDANISDPFTFDSERQKQGISSGFNGSLAYGYGRRGTTSQFQFSSTAGISEYTGVLDSGNFWTSSVGLNTAASTKLTPRTTFGISGTAGYAPYYQYVPFLKNENADSALPGEIGYGLESQWVATYGAGMSIGNQFSRRSSVSGAGMIQVSEIPGQGRVDARSLTGALRHNVTRKLGLRIGYGIQETRVTSDQSPDAAPFIAHNIDLGAEYGDGLTFTLARRYTLGLGFGTSIVRNGRPGAVVAGGAAEASTAFVLTGSATLSRPLGRTWSTSLGYSRGTSYVLGFSQPLLSDSVNLGLGGRISTRLRFSSSATYMRGSMVFSGGGALTSRSASANLTFALTRYIGAYAQSSYYLYDIPQGFSSVQFSPHLQRRSASVGLTLWAPIISPRAKP